MMGEGTVSDEELVEVLLVEHSDDGRPIRNSMLVGDRLVRGEPHPNGVMFKVSISDIATALRSAGFQVVRADALSDHTEGTP